MFQGTGRTGVQPVQLPDDSSHPGSLSLAIFVGGNNGLRRLHWRATCFPALFFR
jgi:hypothetical protein